MDDLRAMREAKYAATTRRAAVAGPPAPVAPVAPDAPAPATAARPARKPAKNPAPPAEPAPAAGGALCGHRAISGRTCTREHGHAAKSHRYA